MLVEVLVRHFNPRVPPVKKTAQLLGCVKVVVKGPSAVAVSAKEVLEVLVMVLHGRRKGADGRPGHEGTAR